ncbi:uncharacterized protein LOC124374157 [Homalodisca vitripennis]|uniref:uncharacterized protein LOC124374157 n=1 Tax=Homalodisca vitripennis TaxID=197043 RepID=UPI001EEB9E20|nr:uncharacterized protein LOC124374157 [Homalodisca vitripennis]
MSENYRPVVIQPALGKLFESLVLDRIGFSFRHILTSAQHGFAAGRSTTTNLALYESFIIAAFGDGMQVDTGYIDFSKAFDTIIGTKLGYNYSEVPLELVADQLGLAPLYARRRLHDLVFAEDPHWRCRLLGVTPPH